MIVGRAVSAAGRVTGRSALLCTGARLTGWAVPVGARVTGLAVAVGARVTARLVPVGGRATAGTPGRVGGLARTGGDCASVSSSSSSTGLFAMT